MNTFIKQGCTAVIKTDNKGICRVQKFLFKINAVLIIKDSKKSITVYT